MGFTLKALMGDYTLKDCTPSFSSLSSTKSVRPPARYPFRFCFRNGNWAPVPGSRSMRSWFIADRARWDSVDDSYVDLFGLDADSRFWHRRLNACFMGHAGMAGTAQ